MTTITKIRTLPSPKATPRDPSIVHLSDKCCPPVDRTLCGLRIGPRSDEVSKDSTAHQPCAVCFAMHETPFGRCRRCGK